MKPFGGVAAVNRVSLALAPGRIYGLIGPSKSGKTTLLDERLDGIRALLRDRGKTALLVEHDMKVVMGLCETVFLLDHGEKLAEGPRDVIPSAGRVIEAHCGG